MSVLLAKAWTGQDPTGWWASEKLDGVRAVWNGRAFISRLGNTFAAPEWFRRGLPDVSLDGELWCGRGEFQTCTGIVRSHADKGWSRVQYRVFDGPDLPGGFEERQERLAGIIAAVGRPEVALVVQVRCESPAHLERILASIVRQGGEGVMLRQPGSRYERRRSGTLLKVKIMHDAEARVIGHQPGEGKHTGRLGALLLRSPEGTEFACGTGLTDRQRERPPRIGALVTYRYQELSRDGVPRFPAFVGARDYE